MTATLTNLTQHLDSWGWTYEVDEAKSYLVTGVKAKNVEQFTIVIQLLHDGELVRIYTPKLLNIKDHVFKGLVFQAMLNLMWEYSLIRFEYDSTDGEICASIDLLIKDTATQTISRKNVTADARGYARTVSRSISRTYPKASGTRLQFCYQRIADSSRHD